MAKIMVLSTCQTNDETKQDRGLAAAVEKRRVCTMGKYFYTPRRLSWGDTCMKAFRRKCNYDKLIMVVLLNSDNLKC